MKYLVISLTLILLLTPQVIYAVEDDFAVELKVVKEVVSPTEPIYVQFRVKNMGGNELPLYIEREPYLIQPRITYRLQVASISNGSIEEATYGPLSPDLETVTPHSDISLWTLDLKEVFGVYLPDELEPGFYKVSIDGTWEEITSFSAEAYFIVQDVQKVGPTLMLPKGGEIHR